MAGRKKDMHQLVKLAQQQGWLVTHTRNGHYRFEAPTGELVFVPSTPGGARTRQNMMARLRRVGLEGPRKGG